MTDDMNPSEQIGSELIGLAPLMRRAFAGDDLKPLGQQLLARAAANPLDAHALLDLSIVLQLTGNRTDALAVQAEAIDLQPHYTLPAKVAGPGLRLLVLMGPGDLMANTPVEFLVENSDVTLELLYLRGEQPFPEEVPDHDVMLVAVAESETNQPLLERLTAFVRDWPRPVINRPEYIRVLSRDGVCAALRDVPGVEMPLSVRVDRATLLALSEGRRDIADLLADGGFPVIVRPLGSHAGTNLGKCDSAADIVSYLEAVDATQFYLSRFVDYRAADGLFRKYRVALIAGRPYICHYAISQHWMIHYLNAGMTENADKRAEEAACMANFDRQFGPRHRLALEAIFQRMQLPYLGIDCAQMPSGELLIFEVDNAMIVHSMDPVGMFPYKVPAMQKVFRAFRELLADASRTAPLG